MLEKSLDVLRNKELTFWCLYSKEKVWQYTKGVIIWHPLNRWRIMHLHLTQEFEWEKSVWFVTARAGIACFLSDNKRYDQTELERMQQDKWSELYPLLVEFSTYFK